LLWKKDKYAVCALAFLLVANGSLSKNLSLLSTNFERNIFISVACQLSLQ